MLQVLQQQYQALQHLYQVLQHKFQGLEQKIYLGVRKNTPMAKTLLPSQGVVSVTLADGGAKVAVAGRVVWGLRFRLQISITKNKERRKRLCLIQNNK